MSEVNLPGAESISSQTSLSPENKTYATLPIPWRLDDILGAGGPLAERGVGGRRRLARRHQHRDVVRGRRPLPAAAGRVRGEGGRGQRGALRPEERGEGDVVGGLGGRRLELKSVCLVSFFLSSVFETSVPAPTSGDGR